MNATLPVRAAIHPCSLEDSPVAKPNNDGYKKWVIGLGIASFALGAIAAFAIANQVSQNAPLSFLKATNLGKAVISISISASVVTGIAAAVCARKYNEEPEESVKTQVRRINHEHIQQIKARVAKADSVDKIDKALSDLEKTIAHKIKADELDQYQRTLAYSKTIEDFLAPRVMNDQIEREDYNKVALFLAEYKALMIKKRDLNK